MKQIATINLVLGFILLATLFNSSCFPEPTGPTPYNYELYVKERDQYPAWSPDGEQIAYYHFSAQLPEPADYPSGLYIINKDGSNRRLVLQGHHYNPAWSPDGDWLVFSNGGVIQKCRTNGANLSAVDVNEACFFPCFNPNGSSILFDRLVSEEGSLLIVDVDFIEQPKIFSTEIKTARDPEYSPNGDFLTYMKGSNEWPNWEIFVLSLSNNTETRLTTDDANDLGPTWSFDGSKLAWSSNVRIHIMKADGSNKKFVVFGQYPSWSVNNQLVFSHANAGYTKEVLYTINPDGSNNKRQITF